LRKQREREQGAAADRHLNPNLRTLSTRPHSRVYLDIIFPRVCSHALASFSDRAASNRAWTYNSPAKQL
jgi:hypothetical protein